MSFLKIMTLHVIGDDNGKYGENHRLPSDSTEGMHANASESDECRPLHIWDRGARNLHHGRVDADTQSVIPPEASAAGGVRGRIGGWAGCGAGAPEG